MQKDTTKTQVMSMTSRDVITDILRHGAQEMLATAIENEVAQYIADHKRRACEMPVDIVWSSETVICRPGRFKLV